MLKLLPLLFVFACAHQPSFQMDENRLTWMSRSEDDVITHPIFATMPVQMREASSGMKIYSFKNFGGYSSDGECSSTFGGAKCTSAHTEMTCNHQFIVSNKVVTDYRRIGNCGPEQLKFRPLENGEAALTEREKMHFGSRSIANEQPKQKDCGIVGQIIGCI